MSLTSCFKYLLLFIVLLYVSDFTDSAGTNCLTTIKRYGTCKLLNKCEYTTELRRKRGQSSPKYKNFLNHNFCGFNGNHPKICCPIVRIRKLNYEQITHKKPVNRNPKKNNQKVNPKPANKKIEKPQISKPVGSNAQTLLPEWCGRKYDIRIIGGETTQVNEFPWMALLEYEESSKIILGCGGSLISRRYVLTAGHCVSSIPEYWQLKRVRLGEYDTQSDLDCEPEGDDSGLKCADQVLLVSIEQEIVHENFWKPHDYANDIALLRLAQDVPFTDSIHPVCMPTSSDLGNIYWAAGWGKTELKSQSTVKLKVTLPRFNFDKCTKLYSSKNVTLNGSQMCAGGESGKDTCAGDSGGPLMKLAGGNWIIDGIVSMGHRPCGQEGWPAVYTKVFHYLPWILSKLEP